VNEHRAILEAIEAGEADEAARKMSVHLQRLSQYLFGRSPEELSLQGTHVAGPVSRKAGEL
jgi:DNA-binding GntR family transcriptional regulator